MPLAGGRWVSGHENDFVGQPQHPSTSYFPILVILADDPPREQVTNFTLTSMSLCKLTPLFWTLFSFQPCLDGYAADFHRYNTWAAKLIRYAHWPLLVYARNFNSSFIEVLDHYPIKVVFFQARSATREILRAASKFRSPAILVVEGASNRALAESLALPYLTVNGKLPKALTKAIENLARTPPDDYRKKGFEESEIAPITLVNSFPKEFVFSESRLRPYPFTNIRLLRANEVLANSLRRRVPLDLTSQPLAEKRLDALLKSAETVFGERLIDHLVVEATDAPDPDLDPNLKSKLAKYVRQKTPKNYESLLSAAIEQLRIYPGACDLTLCCPAINPRYALESLRTTVPSRILRLVLRRTAADYLDYVHPQEDFRSKEELILYSALMTILATENEYLSNTLSLQALASRRPTLRIPKLSSGLFGRLRALRRGYLYSRPKAFLKQLRSFIEELEKEFPSKILEFVTKYQNLSMKLISDLPIEWLPLEGVPLIYHRNCSRIPMTGNNLFVHYQSSRVTIRLSEEELHKTTILNSLKRDDPIHDFPKVLSELLTEKKIGHTYSEVRSVGEFISVLKATQPFILIHFGHGSYDRQTDRGFLHVGSEKTEIWELEQLTVPPIVMLGACETAAMSETHNTPANGWLAQGARAVLGTLFPVEVDLTITLFARILANLQAAILDLDQLPTWEMVVSKTLMLNRYLDYLHPFDRWRARKGLPQVPKDFILEFTYRWNKLRGISQSKAHGNYIEFMRSALRHFGAEFASSFDNFIETEDAIPHTMFFTQLGSPETIHIVKSSSRIDSQELQSVKYWQRRAEEDRLSAVIPHVRRGGSTGS